MASLQPQTSVNPTKYYFLTDPITASGINFAAGATGGPATAILNVSGILETPTGDILNDSYWSQFPASTGYIDMAPGGQQRITATNSQLYYNGQPLANGGNVADWSYFPVDSGYIDFSGAGQRLTATNASLIYNGVALTGGQGEGWSLYPAQQTVNIAGYNISGVNTLFTQEIKGSFNLGISCVNNMTLYVPSNFSASAIRYEVVAGSVYHPESPGIIDFSTANGLGSYGQINLTANPGILGANGAVYITANGGTDPTGYTAYGGNITIRANTPINTGGVTFSSAVKISAASVLSYAGLVPPVGSNTGINYIFGNLGVSITADVAGPLLTPTPLSVYIFGRTGTSIPSVISSTDGSHSGGLYCADVQPYSDGLTTSDLYIKGRGTELLLLPPLVGNVILENVKKIDGNIYVRDGSSLFVKTEPALEIEGLVAVNYQPYIPTQEWSTLDASSNVNMNGYSIERCLDVQTDTINGLAANPTYPLIVGSATSITNIFAGRTIIVYADFPEYRFTLSNLLTSMYFTMVAYMNGLGTTRPVYVNNQYVRDITGGHNYQFFIDPNTSTPIINGV
jgi:hypothetical protein